MDDHIHVSWCSHILYWLKPNEQKCCELHARAALAWLAHIQLDCYVLHDGRIACTLLPAAGFTKMKAADSPRSHFRALVPKGMLWLLTFGWPWRLTKPLQFNLGILFENQAQDPQPGLMYIWPKGNADANKMANMCIRGI